jgi:alpha-mannosidase
VELALGALKRAEDGRAVILRLYEPHGKRGPATLRFAFGLGSVERVNLLEKLQETIEIKGDEVRLDVRPFEVLTLRVEPGTG